MATQSDIALPSRRLARRWQLACWLGFVTLCTPGVAMSQAGPTLQDVAVAWARGSYGSPLICEIDGSPVRGMRRLQITPFVQAGRPTEAKIIFAAMDVEPGTRCFTDLGAAAPNLAGWVRLRLQGKSHADSVKRDFQQMLKRREGVRFDVSAAQLRIEEPREGDAEWKRVGLRGATAELRLVRPGTDDARLLADFSAPKKLRLEIRDGDNPVVTLPLFLVDAR